MKRAACFLAVALACCSWAGAARSEQVAARVPPLFWYEADPEQDRRFVMALLLYWTARDRRDRTTLLAPLYYSSRNPDERLRILFPVHFLYRSRDQKLELWGPYFARESLRSRTRFLFPFYYDASDDEGRFRWSLIYLSQENERARLDLILPLYGAYRPTDPDRNAYQTLLPVYFKFSSRDRRTIISPLFWSYRDRGLSLGFVPPYFWRHAPGSKIEISLPLYGRYFKEKEGRRRDIRVAVPWFKVQLDSTTFRGFVPLYLGRTKIYPALKGGSAVRLSEWDVVPGLYLRTHQPDGSQKTVTPLFSRFRDRDGETYGHTGPYVFVRQVWGGRTSGIFPFYYLKSEADSSRFRFLFFYRYRTFDGERSQADFFPVLRYRRDWDRSQWLTPLFYSDRDPDLSRGFFLNYFWKTERKGGGPNRKIAFSRRVFFPLVWHSRSEKERTTVIFPLAAFRREEDYRLSLVAPFYFSRTRGADRVWIVPPFIARESPQRHWRGLLFLYWQTARADRSAVTFLPFYRRSKFSAGSSLLLPGFYYLKDVHGGTQGFAGPYLWDFRGNTRYRILAPLYVDFERPTWRLRTLLPVYRFRNKDIDEKGVFPVWAVTKAAEVSTETVPHWSLGSSAVSGSTDTELQEQSASTVTLTSYLAGSSRVLPFYFYRKNSAGSELILPFILGSIEHKRDGQNRPITKGRVLLLGAWETAPDRLSHRFDPLYSYDRRPGRKSFVSPTAPFPLWRYEVSGLGTAERTVQGAVFPYYWKDAPEVRKDFVFPVYYHRELIDAEKKKEKSELTWMLLYYASRNLEEGGSKRLVVPLYWHFADRQGSWTVFPPYWGESGPGYDRRVVFPFWYSARRGTEKVRAVFPIFYSERDPSEKRSVLLFPGYWRSRGPEGFSLLAGNVYSRISGDGARRWSAVFPFYWSGTEPGRKVRTVFPLYWNWRTEGRSVSYLFPLYFHHHRPALDWAVAFPVFWRFALQDRVIRVVPPYFSIEESGSGTRTTGFAPLWTYVRNDRREWKHFQLLGGLFGYERAGEVRRVTLLYFIRL